jgi:hypothetical protein
MPVTQLHSYRDKKAFYAELHETKAPLPYTFADLDFNVEQRLKEGLTPEQIFDIFRGGVSDGFNMQKSLNLSILNAIGKAEKEKVPLGELVGLGLSHTLAADKIVRAVAVRLHDDGTDCAYLTFSKLNKETTKIKVEKNFVTKQLRAQLAEILAQGYDTLTQVGS